MVHYIFRFSLLAPILGLIIACAGTSENTDTANNKSISENISTTPAIAVDEPTSPSLDNQTPIVTTSLDTTLADTVAPTAPGNLRTSSSPTASNIDLIWDASTDNIAISGYLVYRDNILVSTTTSTSFQDNAVTENMAYTYIVIAFDAANNNTPSNNLTLNTPASPDNTDPTSPGGLQTTYIGPNSIIFRWDAATDNTGISHYLVYRDSTQIASLSERAFTDNNIESETSYQYQVSAVDFAGNISTPSNILSVTSAPFVAEPTGTYYISPNGSGIECSQQNPCGSFVNAFNVMSGGDTLIVMNGTYHQSIGEWVYLNGLEVSTSNPPSGTAGKPTTIRAEYDGAAIIIGNDMDLFIDASYVVIEGFSFVSNSGGIAQVLGNNNAIKRSSFKSADTNCTDTLVSLLGDYNLIEDSWVFGSGHNGISIGKVYNYSGRFNTLRRVVVRLDSYVGSKGFNGISLYQAHNVTFDNVLVMDFGTTDSTFEFKGAIRSREGDGSNHNFYGTMVLNNPYDGFISSTTNCENCIAWNIGERAIWQEKYSPGSFNKTTIGNSTTGAQVYDNVFTNTLIYNSGGSNNIGGDFNHFYSSPSTNMGNNYLTNDPQLKYITRIENNTPGFQSGLNNENRGAEIINRYENGVLTNEPLWPYPNQDRIMETMCDSDYLNNVGRTGANLPGMCQSGNGLYGGPVTLTSYIWEMLGSACPAEYCSAN